MIDNTREHLPPCIIGTWAWGSGINGSRMIFGQKADEQQLIDTYARAMALGFTFWDTAVVYGNGKSELLLAQCLKRVPGAKISTKHMPGRKFRPEAMAKSLAASCRRLDIEAPDLYFLHLPMNVSENTHAAVSLLKAGKIKSFGLSNVSLTQAKAAQDILTASGFTLGAIQNHFSLLSNPDLQAPLIQWCNDNQIPFFSYMVLEQGALSGRYSHKKGFPPLCMRSLNFPKSKFRKIAPLLELMSVIAEKYHVGTSQIPIAWAIAKGTVPLIGLTRPQYADDLFAGAKVTLEAEETAALDRLARDSGVVIKGVWEPDFS